MEHLVLKEVNFNHLNNGDKYIIKRKGTIHFIGKFINYTNNIANFDKAYSIHGTIKINVQDLCIYYERNSYKYYRVILQKNKIQEEMELRVVNLLLQRIIGDTSFKY
uniref:Uncharacterized protein n=1 Tax=viral metagenome TaxID=1070528 RepID=A0A6C0ET17_9ZZZZ